MEWMIDAEFHWSLVDYPQKACNEEPWFIFVINPHKLLKKVELLVIWATTMPMWRHCKVKISRGS